MTDTQLLDTEFTVYIYTTTDGEIGSVIVNTTANPKLADVFDNNKLFIMESYEKKVFKLRDLLQNGVLTIGSTDLMETLKIVYPDNRFYDAKPTIKGLYMHGSRKRLIAETCETEFEYEPESDHELVDFDNEKTDSVNSINVDWLK